MKSSKIALNDAKTRFRTQNYRKRSTEQSLKVFVFFILIDYQKTQHKKTQHKRTWNLFAKWSTTSTVFSGDVVSGCDVAENGSCIRVERVAQSADRVCMWREEPQTPLPGWVESPLFPYMVLRGCRSCPLRIVCIHSVAHQYWLLC